MKSTFFLFLTITSTLCRRTGPVTYRNGENVLQFSRMAKERNPNLKVFGNVQGRCLDIDVSGPVTFKTPDSFIKVPAWKASDKGGIKLEFKTTEPHGLLFFAYGNASRDFFALELFDGSLYVIINLGSGVKKELYARNLNDGSWHPIDIIRIRNDLRVTIDGNRKGRTFQDSNRNLDLDGMMYLGGTDLNILANFNWVPRGLFTVSLKYGFVGCMRSVYVDGIAMDLKALEEDTNGVPGSISPECENLGRNFCENKPCKNGGRCYKGWSRFICDCSQTSFTGDTCEIPASTAGFNGSQYLRFPTGRTNRTQAEEISFRFKTPVSSGLLFTTTSNNTGDRLTVKLVKGGQVELTVNIDCFRKNCTAPRQGPDILFQGESLNDNKWHTVEIKRLGQRLSLKVDGKKTENEDLLSSDYTELQYDAIHLGNATGTMLTKVMSDLRTPFVGLIQNLIFNKDPLIDRCFQQLTSCEFTGTWDERNIISNPVTFGNQNSYVAIDTLDAYSSMTLYFTMKTTVSDGLMLYNAGDGGDFIAVELVDGYIHYVYNLGNGPQTISTSKPERTDDNEWHEIRIIRDASNSHSLAVDGIRVSLQGSIDKLKLDLDGPLYIGGLRQDLYYNELPDSVMSRFGYQGCMGTFDFNGITPQLLRNDRLQMYGDVRRGCIGPVKACTGNSCLNGGICRQEWNSYSCDCSMSSYVGKRCSEHISLVGPAGSTSYRFENGLVVYRWPSDPPSSRNDALDVGFVTTQRNCVVAKISSLKDAMVNDYLRLEIENGRLTLRFNIGSKDIVLSEPKSVADGQYHRVTIKRIWMNATLQVDKWPVRKAEPNGTKNTVFNAQSMIQVGGLLMADDFASPNRETANSADSKPKIVRPFRGLMTGFFFNGIKVFTLAEQGSEQVSIVGSVSLLDDPPISTTPPVSPTTMATTTIFTTSSSNGRPIDDPNSDTECDGEEACTGDQANSAKKDPMLGDDQTSQVTPRQDGIFLATGTNRVSTGRITVNAADGIVSVKNGTNINGSGNLLSRDIDKVGVKKSGFFSRLFSGTTAMIAGIVGAAVISIMGLLFAIYKYKHRDGNVYRAGKHVPNTNGRLGNGGANGHPLSTVRKKDGPVNVNGQASIRGREVDKEYYV